MVSTKRNFIALYRRTGRKTVLLHLCCWTLLILYELGSVYYIVKRTEPYAHYLCYYAVNIAFFYLLTALAGQFWQRKYSAWLTAVYILLAFLLFLITKCAVDFVLAKGTLPVKLQRIKAYIPANIIRGIYFGILAAFYRVASYLSFYRRQAAEARIAFLQQQLQPHLLFNALNFVYNKVDQHSPEAARCVWLLAELMRFSLTSTSGKVALTDEAQQLNYLIEINRYRFGEEFYVKTDISDELTGAIIPLVLITLTENLFKHGDLQDERHPAFLQLHVKESQLYYHTLNRKRTTGRQPSHRIGLENIRVRLDHAYGRNYQFTIHETAQAFELELRLPL
ncbi:MAG: histidine kinase [Bacteroidota bacterium]